MPCCRSMVDRANTSEQLAGESEQAGVTLSEATVIGFAVAGSAPTDVRQWITIDMAGFPGTERRGYVVATEPLNRSWHGIDLANRAREIILTELRRLRHLSPDEALGRSLAAANGIVVSQNHEAAMKGLVDDLSQIGVSAIVFEDNLATIAHVPPGQMILVEDGLVYTVPEFQSWFPGYTQPLDVPNQAEPLGYATWTAPLMAQTEVRAGDTLVFCTAALGRAYVEGVVASGYSENDLIWMHHRDPDKVLDHFKEVVIAEELVSAAMAVVSFPPLASTAQVQTLADVKLRTRDTIRHAKAGIRQLRPSSTEAPIVSNNEAISDLPEPVAQVPVLREGEGGTKPTVNPSLQERLQRVFEPKADRSAGWNQRSATAEFGVPGRHGVNLYRTTSQHAGDTGWRGKVPRLPVVGSLWIWPILLLLVAGLVLLGLWIRDDHFDTPVDPDQAVAQIDQSILSARDESNSAVALEMLNQTQQEIDQARESGLSEELLGPRQMAVTNMIDAETHVVRMSDVQRIGSLPEEFGDATVQGVNTPAGVFFVAGGLYQYRPNESGQQPELVTILEQGEKVGNATVGALWGVAFDIQGLYVTDGQFVFMLPVESQEWRAIELGRVNDQEWKPGPLAAFDGSVYLLQAEYRQIYRFSIASSKSLAQPVDWLLTGARDRADQATDIAIDGNIYMLIEDGTMQLLRLGDLQSEVLPKYVGDDRAVSLVGRGSLGYLYEAVMAEDMVDSRILAFPASDDNSVQLMLPIGFTTGDANVTYPFEGLQDIVVDESTGTIYIINADGIWTARFSLPALPDVAVPTETPSSVENPESPSATPTSEDLS